MGRAAQTRVEVSQVSARHLAWSDGSPLLIVGPGDPEGFLHLTTANDQEDRIDKLIAQGGNCIYMHMVQSHGGDGGASDNPWVSGDPANGLDSTKMADWNAWLDRMEAARIVALMFFYDDNTDVWNDGTNATLGNDEKGFIDDIVAELGHHGNIIWLHSEEYGKQFTTTRSVAFCDYLRSVDTYPRPIGWHQQPGQVADDALADAASTDLWAVQTVSLSSSAAPPEPADTHTEHTTAYSDLNGRAHLGAYEIHPWHSRGTSDNTRQVTWAALMAGASVAVIEWFIDDTPNAELNQARYAQEFFEASRMEYMTPDDTRAAGETEWVLDEGANSFICYSRTAPNNLGITLLDAVNYDLYWLDPETGDKVTELGVAATSGTNTFDVPAGITSSEVAVYGVKS